MCVCVCVCVPYTEQPFFKVSSCYFNFLGLHLDSAVEIKYHFDNDDDPCQKILISWDLQLSPLQPINESLFIAVCVVRNFVFPPYYKLVSPIFYFWSNNPIQESIELDMDHCVSAETCKLSFVSTNDATGPPFQFSLLDGGKFKFNSSSSSGVICTRPQGLLAIMNKKLGHLTLRAGLGLGLGLGLVKYRAQMYYTWDTPSGYEVTGHFVVALATKAWDQVCCAVCVFVCVCDYTSLRKNYNIQ